MLNSLHVSVFFRPSSGRYSTNNNTKVYIFTSRHKLRFFRALSSVVRQMPGLFSQRRGTVRTLHVSVCCVVTRFAVLRVFYTILCIFYIILCIILYYSMYRLCEYVCLCVYVYKPLPPGVYPIADEKYISLSINYIVAVRSHWLQMHFYNSIFLYCIQFS
jgi:hypothetical protein